MLDAIGVSSFEELLAPVPETFRLTGPLELYGPRSEYEIARWMGELAARNRHGGSTRSFLGGGSYDHMVPAAIDHVSFRSEFYTAYTPYQPEVAQATLTAIYEFQTMMSELTGMDLANASLYDGGSALAEAALLATAVSKRKRVVVAGPLNPGYREVLETFSREQGIEVVCDPCPDGVIDRDWVTGQLAVETGALVLQVPNFFGIVEDVAPVFDAARASGAVCVQVFEPHALALYRSPGSVGADIAVAEGLSLGSSPSFGGPALGLFACNQRFVRYVPGRLVGETVDRNGKRAYVLTLQTREQHIRREKATSNICTNQGLLALRATLYLSLMGPEGMREAAQQCLERSHYIAQRLGDLEGFSLPFGRHHAFHEFVLECPIPAAEVIRRCLDHGVVPGIDMARYPKVWGDAQERWLLVCATEKNLRPDLDALVDAVRASVGEAAGV